MPDQREVSAISGYDPDATHRRALQLCSDVPEMGERYLELVDLFEDDLGDLELLGAVADLVSEELREHDESTVVDGCLAFVEQSAEEDDTDAVTYGFLDQLEPEALLAIAPMLGPRTAALLEGLTRGEY
jgi:hypothetical protein